MDGSVSTELILLAVLVVGVFLLLVFVLLLLVRTAVTNSDRLVGTVNRLVEKSEDAFLAIQTGNERKLAEIQASNEQRLDAMRQLVDEKLQSTLEQRLGESFRLVGERLEAVQRGLGEMQALANGVGDLKRILVNVRERGTWGEYQLGAILEDILTPGQYEANVRITEGREQVEYAVKLPGRGRDAPVWLPIDAKFPKESYERLVEAATAADAASVQSASAELRTVVARMAQDIQRKYICPPASTDFAILFLPTEGLFAEVLRLPGLHDTLQRKHRVLVAGPTTLAAILNSLRVGFQTLAIEQRAGEVWQVLGAVKTEFGTFSNYLDLIKRQIQTVSNTLDLSSRRTRAMQRKLRSVEELPRAEAGALLGLPVDEPLGGGAEDDVEEDSEEVQ
jgi:DNA recombination protein RmuC